MFLRALDAFGKSHRNIEGLSIIVSAGATAGAAAISPTFGGPKGSGSSEGDLSIAGASFRVDWLFARTCQLLADADDGSGMPPFDGDRCPCL